LVHGQRAEDDWKVFQTLPAPSLLSPLRVARWKACLDQLARVPSISRVDFQHMVTTTVAKSVEGRLERAKRPLTPPAVDLVWLMHDCTVQLQDWYLLADTSALIHRLYCISSLMGEFPRVPPSQWKDI